jgi:hypothetical protein
MRLIFKNELKNASKRKYIIAFVLIALIVQIFIQVGKLKHLENIENRNSLQEAERAKVSHYTIYRQYATFGIILMFVPSHFGILYNDSTFELLVSHANISFLFDINLPKKAKELFAINSPFMNFMGISLLLVFYFGIFYGIDTTNKTSYLKFLSNRSGTKIALRFTIFFRLLLLNAAFLLMFVINISLLLLNNINLFQSPLLLFFWGLFLVTSFSFGIGCILGTIKSNLKRNTAFFVIYFVSGILLLLFLNLFTKIKADDIKPVFEINHDNLKAVMLEEENMMKKHGLLPRNRKPTAEEIKDARESLFRYNEKIMKNLDRLKAQLISKIKARKFIAALFPTLFYFSICEDASTNSYDRFIDFYTFSQNRKEEFVQFCVDKIYPLPDPENETPAPGKQITENSQEGQSSQGDQDTQPVLPQIENFIKNDEDLFFAKSKIPCNFWFGSILSLLWIAGCLVTAYRRSLKELKGEPGEIRDFDVNMKSDEFNYLLTADQGLKSQVYNSHSGDGFTSVNIKVDGEIFEPKDFLYVYETKQFLKDIDQKSLYKVLFGKEMPFDLKPWQFLPQYAAESNKFLLLDNFFIGMDINEIEKFIDAVKRIGVKALYIGKDYFQAINIDDHVIFCRDDLSIPGIAEKVNSLRSKK